MKYKFSFVIPVHDEAKTIGSLLDKIHKLSRDYATQIIVIDSGSEDKTVLIVKEEQKKNPHIKLLHVKDKDFNHGQTRNIGVRAASGEYVICMSGDVTLKKPFLNYLIEDFKVDKRVVAVFGKQIPYKNTPFIQKIEHETRFERFTPYLSKNKSIIFDPKKPFLEIIQNNKLLWYMVFDTFACYKRSYLLKNPFKKTKTLEDFLIGKDIVDQNLIKIYDSRCEVIHSHSLNLLEYFKQEREHLRVRSKLVGESGINIVAKIKKINKSKIKLIKKIQQIFMLGFYYGLKLIIVIEYKLSGFVYK